MDILRLRSLIEHLPDYPLPGIRAHLEMMPESRKNIPQNHADFTSFRNSAVLLLIHQRDDEFYFPLIKRTESGIHGGQIGLPGGKQDAEESLWETALREANEEIRADTTAIRLLRPLTPLFIPVSRFAVQPFIALSNRSQQFIPQQGEVIQIYEIPLLDFLKRHHKNEDTFGSHSRLTRAPCLVYDNLKIWGATSMILNEFISLLLHPASKTS